MERATRSRVESSMRLGSYFSMKRSPSLLRRMPPSPRTASVTRSPCTPGGHTIPVGWNCTNSMSSKSAPASYARVMPSPVHSQELDVIGKAWPITSNSWECTGDGITLAYEAGADLLDMEFVQFHPTGMVWPPGVQGLLVTEAVRGEGGILRNKLGERFMEKYDPKRMELSTRDLVARSIYTEVKEGRGSEHGGAFLDISHKPPEYVKQKLPSMYHQFKELADVDITQGPMEVGPTCHYMMGGILVNAETTATTLSGLFAAGEAAAGLHGANRLGGNSLSDLVVFGRRAGQSAAA